MQISANEIPFDYSGKRLVHEDDICVIRLGPLANKVNRLDVAVGGFALTGSPIRVKDITMVAGFVTAEGGAVSGWCWYPNSDDYPVNLTVENVATGKAIKKVVAKDYLLDVGAFSALSRPRRFEIPLSDLPPEIELVRIIGPGRTRLDGNPLDPFGESQSAKAASDAVAFHYPSNNAPPKPPPIPRQPSVPIGARGLLASVNRNPRPVDVVIPVYRGRTVTMKAIHHVLQSNAIYSRIIVVSDASPDADLVAELELLAKRRLILLHKQSTNRGFPGAVNIGIRLAGENDVVVLNSDAYVSKGWLSRLREVAYSDVDIGTVTPISNDATIYSYPQTNIANPTLSDEQRTLTADCAWDANGRVALDIPTAHGFCVYIRRHCLDDIGLLREDIFGRGYGEENDFSMRAYHKGWRNVVAPGIYVGHVGGQSFTAARTHLIARNLQILNRLHPGYDRLVQAWIDANPLAPARRKIDIALLRRQRGTARLMLFVTHNRGGGVTRHVRERMEEFVRLGLTVALIRPGITSDIVEVRYGVEESGINISFKLPREMSDFQDVYSLLDPFRIEIHHTLDINPAILEYIARSKIPYSVTVHDFHWYCPRINLTRGKAHYCKEPPVEYCRQCVRAEGSEFQSDIDPVTLTNMSQVIMRGATSVISPSHDTAERISRRLGVTPIVRPWEPALEKPLTLAKPERGDTVRICIVGAIGWEKGYGVLLEIAQAIAFEKLPVELCIVGYTCDDDRLNAFDCVSITGRYEESELPSLIEGQEAHLGLFPAVWPETWSYVLTAMWQAGLRVVAFDIGAPAERIRATMGGYVVPLETSPRFLAHSLMNIVLGG